MSACICTITTAPGAGQPETSRVDDGRCPNHPRTNARSRALVRAMAARLAEPDCRDDDDHIYQLLGELMRLELAMLDGTPRARHEYVVLTLTQALTKMRPSDRILRALR